VDVNLSSADQMRNNAVNNALNNLNMDPSAAQNTAYNMMTRNLNRDFNNQTTSLSNDLINKGVPVGSQAYNDAMARLTDSHNNTLANASDAEMFKGQDYLTGQINQIGALGSQINNPLNQMVSGTGGNFGGNYDKSFESDMMRYKQKMARRNGITGALGSLAGAGVGAAFGV